MEDKLNTRVNDCWKERQRRQKEREKCSCQGLTTVRSFSVSEVSSVVSQQQNCEVCLCLSMEYRGTTKTGFAWHRNKQFSSPLFSCGKISGATVLLTAKVQHEVWVFSPRPINAAVDFQEAVVGGTRWSKHDNTKARNKAQTTCPPSGDR